MFSQNPIPPKQRPPIRQLRPLLWNWRGMMVTIPSVTGFVLALRLLGVLQSLEWGTLDTLFQLRSSEPPDPRIVIVGISETDLQAIQQVPISDAVLAKLLNQIKQQQPRAIGLDLYRDLPVEPGHQELVKVFESTPNLVGIEKAIGDDSNPLVPPPPALKQLGQVAMNDVIPDADGKIRRSLLILTLDEHTWIENLSLKLAELYLAPEGIMPNPNAPYLQLGKTAFFPFQANDGGYVRADDAGYQLLINFRGSAQRFRTVSLMDVLQGRIEKDLMRDRIVLIGATAPSLKDLFYTPFSSHWGETPEQMTGVEIQANMTSQLVSATLDGRPLIQTLPEPLEWAWIAFWSGTGAVLVAIGCQPHRLLLGLLLVGSSFVGVSFLAFVQSGWWLPIVPGGLGLVAAAVAMSVWRSNTTHPTHHRARPADRLGTYMLPKSVIQMRKHLQNPEIREQAIAKQITATVLSIKVQNFDRIIASLDPEILMNWLGSYTQAITQQVLHHQGIVDQFRDNTVTAIFGIFDPQPTEITIAQAAQQAFQCALDVSNAMATFNQQWQQSKCPSAKIQMAIATGDVIAGYVSVNQFNPEIRSDSVVSDSEIIGSEISDYVVIGAAIQIASELQNNPNSFHHKDSQILMNIIAYDLNQSPDRAQLIHKPDA